MEELADGAVKGVLRLVSLVILSLIWLIWEFCFEIVAWYVGWPICRALSLGALPRESITDHERASDVTGFMVSAVGLGAILGTAIVLAQLTGSG